MGDRLVIWGNGSQVLGRYNASKDVASAAIAQLPGGIKVDWGPLGVDVIPGDDWSITNTENQATGYSFYGANWRMNGNDFGAWGDSFSYGKRLGVNGVRYAANSFFLGKTVLRIFPPLSLNESVYGYVGIEFFDSAGNLYYWIIARTFPQNAPWTIFGMSVSIGGLSVISQNLSNGQTPAVMNPPVYLIVTSNTGASSQRQTTLSPSVSILPAGCEIALTFADNSTKQIPLDSCPEWVQLKAPNACPDGTIKQCDHGATTCCYACVNGRLTLIDSFNKIHKKEF